MRPRLLQAVHPRLDQAVRAAPSFLQKRLLKGSRLSTLARARRRTTFDTRRRTAQRGRRTDVPRVPRARAGAGVRHGGGGAAGGDVRVLHLRPPREARKGPQAPAQVRARAGGSGRHSRGDAGRPRCRRLRPHSRGAGGRACGRRRAEPRHLRLPAVPGQRCERAQPRLRGAGGARGAEAPVGRTLRGVPRLRRHALVRRRLHVCAR